MRITIPIFVAGEVSLKEKRQQLMALSSEITSHYHKNGDDIVVLMNSFETLGNNQEDYNDFIENKADIVLFVLNDKMGEKTEKEYILAEETHLSSKSPENHVFLKKYDEDSKSSEINHIEEVMENYKSYYTLYDGDDDLKEKVKQVIEDFIDKRIKQSKKTLNIFKNIAFLATVLALCLAGYGVHNYLNPDPMLVFSGGGSVYNFIRYNPNGKPIDIRDFTKSIYINQASGSSWALLVEEAYRKGKQDFHSVCLSADRIDTTFMDEKNKAIFDKARIIELILGHDALMVCVKNQLAAQFGFKSDTTINNEQLRDIINKIDAMNAQLFSTSKTSGTLRTYQNLISLEDSTINLEAKFKGGKCILFYDKSDDAYMNSTNRDNDKGRPYVALGSQYYYPEEMMGDFTRLFVTNGNDTIKKPICIYFVATNVNDSEWVINDRIIDFLKKIDANKLIDEKYWKDMEKCHINLNGTDNDKPTNINDMTSAIYQQEIKRLQLMKKNKK